MMFSSLLLAAVCAATVAASPIRSESTLELFKRRVYPDAVIKDDFADPGLLHVSDGRYFAYSTTSFAGNIPYATSPGGSDGFRVWTRGGDAMPILPQTIHQNQSDKALWAPEVIEITPNDFRMYFTIRPSSGERCIGVARSSKPEGPFKTVHVKLVCDEAGGGVIDPATIRDGNTLYLLWKVDGNHKTNNKPPYPPTPIRIQPLSSDGLAITGAPVTLIDRDDNDGPLIEAPSLIAWQGWYYLFFSSNQYDTTNYDVSYAVSRSLTTGYTKVQAPNAPLLTSKSTGLYGPGHASVINIDNARVNMVFAAGINNGAKPYQRAMYIAPHLCVANGIVKLDC